MPMVRPHTRRPPRRRRSKPKKKLGWRLFKTPQEKAARERQRIKDEEKRLKEDILREKIDKSEAEDRLYREEGHGRPGSKGYVGKLI